MYDIIYLIYFYIDDYDTASNFWLLNKIFTEHYMNRYNKNYEFKFKLLVNKLDNILVTVAQDKLISYDYENDKDIKFCYNLYKYVFIKEFLRCDFDYNRKCSWCSLLVYSIFYKGSYFLNQIYKIKCVKNKVKLICKIYKKHEMMSKISYINNLNVHTINKYKDKIEELLN